MKTVTIWVVIIALTALGGYVYMNQEKTPEVDPVTEQAEERLRMDPNLNTGAEQPTVRYNDGGFEPKTMSIVPGQRVEFMNFSAGELHVSFGEHLDHGAYPDGVTHPSLKPNESDAITFPANGTYEYHNHHDEAHTGTVIVQ